jgi:hypothetical protein
MFICYFSFFNKLAIWRIYNLGNCVFSRKRKKLSSSNPSDTEREDILLHLHMHICKFSVACSLHMRGAGIGQPYYITCYTI